MTRYPGVHARTGSSYWWFYQAVPSDLLHHFPSKWAERGSLKTRDLREANSIAKQRAAAWDSKFSALRSGNDTASAASIDSAQTRLPQGTQSLDTAVHSDPLEAISPELAQTLARMIETSILSVDAMARRYPAAAQALERHDSRAEAATGDLPDTLTAVLPLGGGIPDALADAREQRHKAADEEAAKALARGRTELVRPMVDAAARRLGFQFNHAAPGALEALHECLKAYRRACKAIVQRDAGEDIATPTAPPAVAQTTPKPPIQPAPPSVPVVARQTHTPMDAYRAWAASPGSTGKPRPAKTLKTYEGAAHKLAAMLDHKCLEDMTREDGLRIRADLLSDAQKRGGTAAQNAASTTLGRFQTLLNMAVDLEWLGKNPLTGRKIPKVKSERQPWNLKDLPCLFDDPIFRAYELPTAARAGKDAAYWLPLLGLYTGARVSELAQLGIDDLTETEEAGWVLSIHEDGENQSVKNQHSVRQVPVHPELVRLGLLDYHKAIKVAGADRLWPAVVFCELNGAGGEFSKFFGKYKTEKGFDKTRVFHSFRHTLETSLRALSIPKYHIAALAGHAGEDVSDDYAHPTPEVLRPVLERLQFPGLDLPRVFRTPAWKPSDGLKRKASHPTA